MANTLAKELRERSGSSLREIANLLEVGRATLRKRLKNCGQGDGGVDKRLTI